MRLYLGLGLGEKTQAEVQGLLGPGPGLRHALGKGSSLRPTSWFYLSKLLLLRIMASSISKPVYDITATTALVPWG